VLGVLRERHVRETVVGGGHGAVQRDQ